MVSYQAIYLILFISMSMTMEIVIGTESDCPTVKTADGTIIGKHLTTRNGRQYEAFLGMRYGVIPERFDDSISPPSWEGSFNATEFGSFCAQLTVSNGLTVGTEDCLFMNVYTPKSDDKKRPVLFFVHGGGFAFGSGDIYGGKFLLEYDMVLVTINYRVGILGFLNTRDGLVNGNMGLKDQVLGLKWVQKHITHFGGDPSRVTLAGHSAGSASVSHHSLSPISKGLFHGIIAESGSAINNWAFKKDGNLKNAKRVGVQLSCDMENTKALVSCLKEKSLSALLGAQSKLATWYLDPMIPFTPTLELTTEQNPKPFLPVEPAEVIKSGNFNPVPMMYLVTKDEGTVFHAAFVLRNEALRQPMNDEWERIAPITFYYEDNPRIANVSTVAKKLRNFYIGDAELSLKVEKNFTDLYSDAIFIKGISDMVLGLAKYTKVYLGVFTHRREDFSVINLFGLPILLGVSHGAELGFHYNVAREDAPNPLMSNKDVATPADVAMSKSLVKTYTSFVLTGVPEPDKDRSSDKWVPVTAQEIENKQLNWFDLGVNQSLRVGYFKDRMEFWNTIYCSL